MIFNVTTPILNKQQNAASALNDQNGAEALTAGEKIAAVRAALEALSEEETT